jgi:hypothetical protein
VGAALAGVGAAVLHLAGHNRDGPGTVCHTTGTGIDCVDEWSPWPFAVVGVALVLGSVFLVRFLSRHHPTGLGAGGRLSP